MKNNLKKLLLKYKIPEEAIIQLKDLEWKAQEAQRKDVLFYRLTDESENSIKLLKQRISKSDYGLVVINSKNIEGVERSIQLDNKEYFELRNKLADELYPIDQSKQFIAITGTNGKTTTVDIISQLLEQKSKNCLSIGTLGARINREEVRNFSLTSPDYIDLRKTLFSFKDEYDVCALEASSHAIDQYRLGDLKFHAIGWTSFSQDHLDYHHTMDEYFKVKKRLLNHCDSNFNVSSLSEDLIKALKEVATIYSGNYKPKSEFFKSKFNQINLHVALGCLAECDYQFTGDELEKLIPPPGRFNTFKSENNLFVIDFAHTPDALENICKELKLAFEGQKLICVFGCGGNRDKAKRPMMGEAASRYCDLVVITSDNPRFEEPMDIIQDIEKGIQNCNYEKIVKREDAIEYANSISKNAIILIAGKGHEPYIDIAGEKIPYSDKDVVKRLLKK